jgi:biotin synthase-related radical SAM superfamily protein
MSSRNLMIALETCDPEALQAALARKREAVSRFEKFTGKSWNI